MSDESLNQAALSVVAGFLAAYGMVPIANDGVESRDYGPHRLWVVQANIPAELLGSVDPDQMLDDLSKYLRFHNSFPLAVRFNPYDVVLYSCPCGCGGAAFISIFQ